MTAIGAGYAILIALGWRRREAAVQAIEDRDGVRFHVEPSAGAPPLEARSHAGSLSRPEPDSEAASASAGSELTSRSRRRREGEAAPAPVASADAPGQAERDAGVPGSRDQAPTIGPPIGVEPMKTIEKRAMTRPRIAGAALS